MREHFHTQRSAPRLARAKVRLQAMSIGISALTARRGVAASSPDRDDQELRVRRNHKLSLCRFPSSSHPQILLHRLRSPRHHRSRNLELRSTAGTNAASSPAIRAMANGDIAVTRPSNVPVIARTTTPRPRRYDSEQNHLTRNEACLINGQPSKGRRTPCQPH